MALLRCNSANHDGYFEALLVALPQDFEVVPLLDEIALLDLTYLRFVCESQSVGELIP